MKHLPLGYTIMNGEIIVDIQQAEKVQQLFELYLSGNSLNASAKQVGIIKTHASISNILSNEKYIGKMNYPQIIEEDVFYKVQDRRKEQLKRLTRKDTRSSRESCEIVTNFVMNTQMKQFDNPFKEAEYQYSLIGLEV